jgi:hypothetical protein
MEVIIRRHMMACVYKPPYWKPIVSQSMRSTVGQSPGKTRNYIFVRKIVSNISIFGMRGEGGLDLKSLARFVMLELKEF